MEGRDARAGDDRVSLRLGEDGDAMHGQPLRAAAARGTTAWAWRHAKKVVVGIIGGTMVLIGLALLVLPGPGIITIILGLAILATEYAFARRWLRMARERAKAMAAYAHLRRQAEAAERPED